MKTKVYVALSTFAKESAQPLELLKASGLPFEVNPTGKRLTKEEVIAKLQGYDGVVAGLEPYDAQVLSALPQLKCVSRCGVGVDNIDLSVAKARGIAVLNTPQVVVQPVAELTLALIFDLLRKTTAHATAMRRKKWERFTGSQLAGKTIGIIGLGRIGRRVAELLGRLDAKVIGFDVKPDAAWAKTQGVTLKSLDELLVVSDIVSLHVAGHFCLGTKELARMKKGAIVINTARGALIDEGALVDALRSGHLAGAGLDVYAQEPYTGPLCDLPNVVLTPHVATLTQESRLAMEAEAVENMIRFFKEGKI